MFSSKLDALLRRLIIGALNGDGRSLVTLFRIAEQTGEFKNEVSDQPLTIQWQTTYEAAPSENTNLEVLPVSRKVNTE